MIFYDSCTTSQNLKALKGCCKKVYYWQYWLVATLDGKQMYETVRMYADSNQKWINDFTKAWEKMARNGYNNDGGLRQGPTGFWKHF